MRINRPHPECTAHSSSSKAIHIGLAGLLFGAAIASGASLAVVAESAEPATTVFYVSTSGNDQWSGRLPAPAANREDGPFATLSSARDAIRALKDANALPGAAMVMLLDGTFHLAEPLVLTPKDTGDEKHPVTWSAYPGHHPVLSGSRVINDWKPSRGRIISYTDPTAMLMAASATTKWAVAECDHNLYSLATKQEPQIRGIGSFSDWKKLGFDQHSLVADLLFVDAENGDYRLQPESPAFTLGFQPIPVDKIGPRNGLRPRDAAQ